MRIHARKPPSTSTWPAEKRRSRAFGRKFAWRGREFKCRTARASSAEFSIREYDFEPDLAAYRLFFQPRPAKQPLPNVAEAKKSTACKGSGCGHPARSFFPERGPFRLVCHTSIPLS